MTMYDHMKGIYYAISGVWEKGNFLENETSNMGRF